jgi:UDP-2-acetamido-2,6-beta-L-arabino-hexul-4-ose reductase
MTERPEIHTDERGSLYEIPKALGTTFISRSNPGVRRGDHYHLDKTEWFIVLSGEAILYTRVRNTGTEIHYALHGSSPYWVEIEPEVVHAIENVGDTELILLVQSSTTFDKKYPDTYPEIV